MLGGQKMNKILYFFLIVFLLVLGTQTSFTQQLKIVEVFPETYPDITVEFRAYDNSNNEIRTYSVNDFDVLENEIKRVIKSVTCPPVGQTKFSLVLTIDISQSMSEPSTIPGKTKMDVVKEAARNAIKSLPADSNRWEAAITLFDYENELIRGFTNSKWWLNKGLDTSLLNPRGGTDYNAGFLYDVYNEPGALLVARKAKYKPVVIFLTDGKHEGRSSPPPSRVPVWVSQILDTARKYDVTIYAITLGFPVPTELNQICSGTPSGVAYESVPSDQELSNLYSNILTTIGTIGTPAPCKVKFVSDCSGGNLKLIYKINGTSDSIQYAVPSNILPVLQSDKTIISVVNKTPSSPFEQTLTLRAKNNFVKFYSPGVISPDGNVSVTDWGGPPPPFTLDKDSVRTVKVSFTPYSDSSFHSFKFTFTTSACSGNEITVNTGWIYPLDVDCGSGSVGVPKPIPQKTIFCNNWSEGLTIYSVKISGGDQSDFKLNGNTTNIGLSAQSCLYFDIVFTPGDANYRESKLIFDTDKGRFESKIYGLGSGQPEITTITSLGFQNADCKSPTVDTSFYIKSTGALSLDISKFEIIGANASDFSFVPANPGPQSIPPSDSFKVTIRFNPAPTSKGNLTANLVITSNAKNAPTMTIPLSGFSADYNFTTSTDNHNFGYICPNDTAKITLTIQNTGNVDLQLTLSITNPYQVSPISTVDIAKNSSSSIEVSINSAIEGLFNGTLTITDNYCGVTKQISFRANVESPKINKQPIPIYGIVAIPTDTTVTLINNSNRQLTITSAQFRDPQITIRGPSLPWVIAPRGTFAVDIRYVATTGGTFDAYLVMEGTPCNFLDSILFTSNPIAARADIVIEKHTGLIGEIVQIPILIKNGISLNQSGTTRIKTQLSYDETMLKFVNTTPVVSVTQGVNSLLFDNIPFSPTNFTPLIISFEVLNSSNTYTDLILSNTMSIDGFIKFNEIAGNFEILPSSAEIWVGNVEAKTGEEFTLPIYLKVPRNITSFHQSISTELRFNYSLMEPIAPTPMGTINGTTTTIKIDNLPTIPNPTDSTIANLRFRAKLGTDEFTDIVISNTKTTRGFVTFKENVGKLTITNICKSGGPRLFYPRGAEKLIVAPNYDAKTIDIRLLMIESGSYTLQIFNTNGVMIYKSTIDLKEPNEMFLQIPFQLHSEGTYIVVLNTPSIIQTQKFIWIK